MDHLLSHLLAGFTGFISGLILCVPVGPVNLTIMNEGARRGLKWATLIGSGAVVMEIAYCAIAFTGFASLFDNHVVKASMELFSFVFLFYLGIKFLTAKAPETWGQLGGAAGRIQEQIGERLHPHSAFMIGFVRVMANPGVLLGWIILATYFLTHGWVQPTLSSKLACVTGVAIATGLFFFCLGYGASRGHGKFSAQTLVKMAHYSGIGLIILAIIHGAILVWQMAKHKI